MKQLLPPQQKLADKFLKRHRSGLSTLDTSDMGTGKTVVASWLAKECGKPVAVICPKSVIPSWERELKEMGVEPVFVLNYEKIRRGVKPFMSKVGKRIMKWSLNPETLILMDEVHYAAGAYTQNAQLLISLKQQGYTIHMMSGTASRSPTGMRAIGYALGLHSLNKPEGILRNWYGWMRHYGCSQNNWNAWELKIRSKLKDLKRKMYEGDDACAGYLTIADLPDAFKKNRLIVEPVSFDKNREIAKAYKELNITPEILDKYILDGTVEDNEHVIVNMLRARQLTEAYKVPFIVEQAVEAESQGMSVAIFLNFRESVAAACELLENCPRIEGGQKDRQGAIDAFQQDKSHFIVVNSAAGGTGVNLHDLIGNRPRLSLITPSFDAEKYKQVLFRTYRNGAQTDTIQKVLVAADTIEEHVVKLLNKKLEDLESLHRV